MVKSRRLLLSAVVAGVMCPLPAAVLAQAIDTEDPDGPGITTVDEYVFIPSEVQRLPAFQAPADADFAGFVQAAQTYSATQRLQVSRSPQVLQQAFRRADADSNGRLAGRERTFAVYRRRGVGAVLWGGIDVRRQRQRSR